MKVTVVELNYKLNGAVRQQRIKSLRNAKEPMFGCLNPQVKD